MANKIKKGDTVYVIAGAQKGSQGKVLEILADQGRVRVEGIGNIKRHYKPNRRRSKPEGGIVEIPRTVHISNVLPVDESTGRGVRVGFSTNANGKKVRVSRASQQVIK